MNKTCHIIGAGENYGLAIDNKNTDFIIAVDGGIKYLNEIGVTADLFVGDFDSANEDIVDIEIYKLPKEKDDTDTFKAIEIGLQKGYKIFKLYCCSGGRFSHTVANIEVLNHLAKSGAIGYLYLEHGYMTVIHNKAIKIKPCNNKYISIFSQDAICTGVTLKGLKYPLENYTLSNSYPIGVSNEFTASECEIEVKNGSLLIVVES